VSTAPPVDVPPARRALDSRQVALMRAAGVASVSVASLLIAFKTWAWLATDSVSLLGSLADSLLDLIASLITFFAVRVAVEPPDREHRFGHGKSEAIAGLLQSMIVSASALYVAAQAVQRLLAPSQVEAPGLGMGVIGVSLLLTGALVSFQRYVVARTGSLAIGADAVHYKADLLTNLAVIVAIALNYYAAWYLADPLLGLLIVALILHSVRSIAMQVIDVLLDRELPNEVRRNIKEIALSHVAVLGVHDMRSRSSGTAQFIQLHLELEPQMTLIRAHEICDDVETLIQKSFPRAEVMIHADPHGLPESRDSF
jgi:ferrous-iron efflux pump FieF